MEDLEWTFYTRQSVVVELLLCLEHSAVVC